LLCTSNEGIEVLRLNRKKAIRLGLVSLIVTAAAGTLTALGAGAQTPDSPELTMAKSILRDAPADGFFETAPATTPGASGPIVGQAVKAPGYDPVSGMSLSFEAHGYQRYWINKTAGGLVGIIGVELPDGTKPDAFMNDFNKWAKQYGGKTSAVKGFAGAQETALAVNDSNLFELAFVAGNQAYVVVGSGAIVSSSTVLEVAQRQQAASLAAPTPDQPVAAESAADQAVAIEDQATVPALALSSAGSVGAAERFLGNFLRLGVASMVVLGIGTLMMRVGAPYTAAANRSKATRPVAQPTTQQFASQQFATPPARIASRRSSSRDASFTTQLPFG
jgi:hypothetical protein